MTQDATKNPWLTVSSKRVYDNPWITVREDQVVRPDGEPGIYGVVHYNNIAVGVLAIEEDHVYLVGQYRYPLKSYSWEIPEGDRKSTRLNSSHANISYAVFCLKKKKSQYVR